MLVACHVRNSHEHEIAQCAIRKKQSLQLFTSCIYAHTVWGLCWYNTRKEADCASGGVYVRPSIRTVTTFHAEPDPSVNGDPGRVSIADRSTSPPTKTGEFDHSVALDSKYLKPWSSTLLEALKLQSPESKLWDFTYGEYLSAFKTVRTKLQVDLSPYQTRQKRGNWKAHKSVLRYEKAARLAHSYQVSDRHFAITATIAKDSLGMCS